MVVNELLNKLELEVQYQEQTTNTLKVMFSERSNKIKRQHIQIS